MKEKIAGILGGMGIDVTAELLTRIIDATVAAKEQDHIPVIINHNPKIPDRTRAIVYGGEAPLPLLKSSLEMLTKAGVDFIAVPCNTVHYWYDEMQKHVSVPIIHMIGEVVEKSLSIKNGLKKAGLLATTGTVKIGLYQGMFAEKGIKVILPNDDDQTVVMKNIMRIKAREALSDIRQDFVRIAQGLIARNAEIIVIGCTDISLAMKDGDLEAPIVDSLSVLAEKTVHMALGRQ